MKTCTVTSNVGPPTEFQIPELGDPCEKCRAKPSTREVMIMVERPGGVVYYCDDCAAPPIAPAPQWTEGQAAAVRAFADRLWDTVLADRWERGSWALVDKAVTRFLSEPPR